MDDFTLIRLARYIGAYKTDHGRDPSQAEVEGAGFSPSDVDWCVRKGVVDKYHVTTGKGSRENRYKLHRDWRSIKNG